MSSGSGGRLLGSYPTDVRNGGGIRVDKFGLATRIAIDLRQTQRLTTLPEGGLVPVQDPGTGLVGALPVAALPTAQTGDGSQTNIKLATMPPRTVKANLLNTTAAPQDVSLNQLIEALGVTPGSGGATNAANVSVVPPGNQSYTSVQGAITSLEGRIGSGGGPTSATNVSVIPPSGQSYTNVQVAITSIESRINSSGSGGAITADKITDSTPSGRQVLTGSPAQGRTALELGDAATRTVGATGGVLAFDDPRLTFVTNNPHLFFFIQAGDALTGASADYGPVFRRAMNSPYRVINASTSARLPIRTSVPCQTRQKRLIDASVDIFGNFDAFVIATSGIAGQGGADQVFFDDFNAYHYGSGHVLLWGADSAAGGGTRIKIQAGSPSSTGFTGNVVTFQCSYMRFYDININSWRAATTRSVTSKNGGGAQTIVDGWAINIDANDGYYNIESNIDQPNINGTGLGIVVQSSDLTKRPEGVHINVPASQNQNTQYCLRSGLGLSIKGGTAGVAKGACIILDPLPTYSAPGIKEPGLEDIRIDLDWVSAEMDENGIGVLVNNSAVASVVSLTISGLVCNVRDGIILAPNVDTAEINCRFAHIRGTAFQLNGAHNVRLSSTFRAVGKNVAIYGSGPFVATANVFEAGKGVEIDASNAQNYRWQGNIGVKTDGTVSAVSGPTNNINSGDLFVQIPHGLPSTPRTIVLGAPRVVSGGFIGLKGQIVLSDSNNLVVQVFWDGKVSDGTILVTADVSL